MPPSPKRTSRKSDADLEAVARVVHEAVRAWAQGAGDASIPSWSRAPAWMKTATLEAIKFRRDNPGAPASAQHDQWMAEKKAAGWRKGRIKSAVRKTHPMLVPYAQLPLYERRKDALVGAVIDALTKRM